MMHNTFIFVADRFGGECRMLAPVGFNRGSRQPDFWTVANRT
jgi:hypothetical protein